MQRGFAALSIERQERGAHDEMPQLVHHDEQELLCLWEGWHWNDNKGRWLELDLCAKAKREEVEHTHRHNMYETVPRETRYATHEDPSRQDGRRLTKGKQGSPTCARGKTHASPEAGNRKGMLWQSSTCVGCTSTLHRERERSSCRQRITSGR